METFGKDLSFAPEGEKLTPYVRRLTKLFYEGVVTEESHLRSPKEGEVDSPAYLFVQDALEKRGSQEITMDQMASEMISTSRLTISEKVEASILWGRLVDFVNGSRTGGEPDKFARAADEFASR